MSEQITTSVKFLFVPIFVPVFIPIPMAALTSPLGEKQQHVQQKNGTIQPDHGSTSACSRLIGEQEQSFELAATLTSLNPKSCFGQYSTERVEGGEVEPSLALFEEHCVKRGFKPQPALTSSLDTTSVLDTLPLVLYPQHFFSKESNNTVEFLCLASLASLASYHRYSSLHLSASERAFEMAFTKLSAITCSCLLAVNSSNPLPPPPRPNPRGVTCIATETFSSLTSSSCSSCGFGGLCYFDRRDCCSDSWQLVSFPNLFCFGKISLFTFLLNFYNCYL